MATLIQGGLLLDAVRREPFAADLLMDGGKIVRIAPRIEREDGWDLVRAQGLRLYPGLVEAHAHTGLDGYGIGYEGQDYNEYNQITTPHLRAIDGIQPMDPTLAQAREAGVTCLCVGPGSSNVLGGTFAAIKPLGVRVDDLCVKREVAMKCAFGENPKRCYRDKFDTTRMSTAAYLREMLFRAVEYDEKLRAAGDDILKKPAFDIKLQALLPVVRGQMPLKAHAHQADDMFTALRIAREFSVKITLEHATEGHLIAKELAEEGVPVAVGPTLGHASKFELRNKSWETPGALARAGVSVSIITDAPVIPQQHLALCAALAIKGGMDAFDALKAITLNPARHIGVEERLGSLEVGKDADVLLVDGDLFELASSVREVFIGGRKTMRP